MSKNAGMTCELCEASRLTEWFYEDDECWIAECEVCYVPMVVWKIHDPSPSSDVKEQLHAKLAAVVEEYFDYEHYVDDNMRQIPEHYHAHARSRKGWFGQSVPRRNR